ncbi:CNX2 [Scenedesmus sp. PABB004]|nr:CNX2 [Scenedesmus sp. PABB004]
MRAAAGRLASRLLLAAERWPGSGAGGRGSATSAAAACALAQPAAAQPPPEPLADLDYSRRLQEMLAYESARAQRQQRQQQPQEQQQHGSAAAPARQRQREQQQQRQAQQGEQQQQQSAQQQTQQQPPPQQQQQSAAQRRPRRLDLDAVPAFSLPRRQQPAPAPANPGSAPAVDWRAVVEHVRRSGQAVTGERMLTDTFRRKHTYLRISLTERCNLRCTYCMPADGVALTPSQQLLTPAEVERLAALFVRAGVTKIRLTGGEPTVRRDLLEIVQRLDGLRPLGLQTIALTSNGLTLGKALPALQAAGLDALNISLDTLRPERFEALTRRRGHARVLDTIHTAVGLGYDPVKVNVVLMRGVNDDEVPAFVSLTAAAPVNVRFIEYMPFDGNVWSTGKMVPYRELMAAVQQSFPAGLERLPAPAGEVAKNFRVPGFRGSVSFITSMTHAFCGDCNRLRLLADGALKVCLFGANEVSLRDALRGGASDGELGAVVAAAVANKKAAHAGMEVLAVTQNRPMVAIGG